MNDQTKPMVSPGVEAAAAGEAVTASRKFIEEAMDSVEAGGGHVVFTGEELESAGFNIAEVVAFGQGDITVHKAEDVPGLVHGDSPPIWARALAPIAAEDAEAAVVAPVPGDVSSLSEPQSSIVVLRVCRVRNAPTWEFTALMSGVIGDALHGDDNDGLGGSDIVMAWGADPDGTDRYPDGRSVNAALVSGHADAGDGPYASAAGVLTDGLNRDLVNRMISRFRSQSSHMVNIIDLGQITKENARIAKNATLIIALICNEDGEPLTDTEKDIAARVWALALTPTSMDGWGLPRDRCVLVAPQSGIYPGVFEAQPNFGLPSGDWGWRPSDKNGRWDNPNTARRWMRGLIETSFHGLGDYTEEPLPPSSGIKGWFRVRKQKWDARKVQLVDRMVPEINETSDVLDGDQD